LRFLAYSLQVSLKHRLLIRAPELTPAAVVEKLAPLQRIDVHMPAVDGHWLILPRYTQPEPELKILLEKLRLALPAQLPPRITSSLAGQPHTAVAA
jgi:hypothetical protein